MGDRQAELDAHLRVIAQRAEVLQARITELRQRRMEVPGGPRPGDKPTAANAQAHQFKVAAIAAAIADTEDSLADTLDQMARHRPHAAGRLRKKAAEARQYAAQERRLAERYRRTAAPGETAGR